MKHYLINTSNGISSAVPFSSYMRKHYTFYMNQEEQPTEQEIHAFAIELGIKGNKFLIHAISELSSNYRNFGDILIGETLEPNLEA